MQVYLQVFPSGRVSFEDAGVALGVRQEAIIFGMIASRFSEIVLCHEIERPNLGTPSDH